MIKNYFVIALRNLTRRKAFSVINIAGLAIGIASCLLLFTVIKSELSYDKFQPNYNQIFHVVTQDKNSDGLFYTPGVPFPALEALRLEYPEITSGTLLANYGSQVTVPEAGHPDASGGKKFLEESGFFFCDPEFFKVFSYEWLAGSPGILNEPNITALTQKAAIKYFGDWQNAIGKTLVLDNAVTVKVRGILKDIPANTDFPLSIVTSYKTAKSNPGVYFYSEFWGATTSNFQVYMLLPQNVSAVHMNSQLLAFSKKYYGDRKRTERTNFLQPLSDLHFDQRFGSFGDHVTSRSTLWTLTLIGIFIIVMACINFINLSTAQAVKRSKEIGIRKVLGSYRRQLFSQIIGETTMIVIVSVLLAVGIATLSMPLIKHVASITDASLLSIQTILFLLIITVLVTLLAGFYPAFVLSGFNPVLALKNKMTSAKVGAISLRRGLVITQFAISQILVIGMIVAISQMSFVQNADLGFNKEALLIINTNADSVVQSRQNSYKQKLLQIPGVRSVSFGSDVPSSDNNSATNFGFDHKPEPAFALYTKFVDEDYFRTFGLEMLAGRPFDKSDTVHEVVVNETLMHKVGIKNPAEMIGKEIQIKSKSDAWKKITGVVRDFKTNSLREEVKPLALSESKADYGVTAIKVNSKNLRKSRTEIETLWNQYFPEYAYISSFMDENIADFYKQDGQLSLLYKIFSCIAIFISCLGLYGLISFMAIQRKKEIGIRKVLGASVANIIYLFSKEFTILIFIGFIIAAPVAWFMMDSWLQNFVFRIKMNWTIFAIAILISIVVAWLAVGYRSIKAAMANPVKSIRVE